MAINNKKRVIIISGPTAVGKTAVAIEIAKYFGTEIISADSRQCYKELNIGVARPSVEELNTIRHHFIASHSIQEEVTAVAFEQYALAKAAELFKQNDIVVMVGGTGLYIKAFCEGLDTIPDIEPSIRQQIMIDYETKGIGWLQNQIQDKDPAFFNSGEIKNPHRLIRALEVIESTGNSILYYRKGEKKVRDFSITKIGLELPKDLLANRINNRVDLMIENKLLEEVKTNIIHKSRNALQTVGYKELFVYLDGELTLAEAIERIKINTRQYAKRQLTWFKKDKEIKWFLPDQLKEMIDFLK